MAIQPRLTPTQVLIVADSADQKLCKALEKHLSPLVRKGFMHIQSTYDIAPRQIRSTAIAEALNQASVILIFISATFLASDLYQTVEQTLEQTPAEDKLIVPVLLRPVNWQYTFLAQRQHVPHNGKPVTQWHQYDDAFQIIAHEIIQAVQKFAPSPIPNTASAQTDRRLTTRKMSPHHRERLLKYMNKYWIEGILQQSLYATAPIAYDLHMQSGIFANPQSQMMQDNIPPELPLSPETRLVDVYEETDYRLLILGEPGSGKTTLLQTLAHDLLEQAREGQSQPIPVILHLAPWAKNRLPLAQWLVKTLYNDYLIPTKVAQQWVETDQLHLLLDGLDEMPESAIPACIAALNEYLEQHESASVALCCRQNEYLRQETRLSLYYTVVVQPLTEQKVDEYLSKRSGYEALQSILTQNAELRHLIHTPLMLDIAMQTYHNTTETDSSNPDLTSTHFQRDLFATYIQKMLKPHGQHPHYTVQKAERWLEWLAWQMKAHHQVAFYLERLQPDWLSERRSNTIYYACIGLIGMLILGAAAGFIGALVHGKFIAVLLGIIGALLGGLGFVLVGTRIRPVEVLRFSSIGGRAWTFLLIASWLFILLDNILLHSSLSLIVTFLAVVSVIVLAISEALKDTPVSKLDTSEIASPGDGLKRSLKNGIFAGLLCGFGFNLIVGILHVVISSSGNLPIEYGLGAIFGLLCGLTFGGLAAIQIKIVQWLLSRTGVMPTNYIQFLNYATEHLLLRKVGGGYIFVHNLLLEHLASRYAVRKQ